MQLELRKLDKMEIELWQAWENSKGSKRKTKIRGGNINEGIAQGGELLERSLETTDGDPRYLDLLLKIQERRAKLLGYNAPIKIDFPALPAPEVCKPNYNVSAIPEDLLLAVADKLQNAKFEVSVDLSK